MLDADPALALAVPVTLAVPQIVKVLVDAPRPLGSHKHDQQSFPSGHAAAVVALAAGILLRDAVRGRPCSRSRPLPSSMLHAS